MTSLFQIPANLFQLFSANLINYSFELLRLPIEMLVGLVQ